jgi:glycine betaine/proline transport system substrate-binding protein
MLKTTLSALALTAAASAAFADCETITFSDVGWTDITATTATATTVLEALGYETETKILSVPVTYQALAAGDLDVFLGNWMPTMEADIAPYREAGTVDTVRANLEGAKYTLAVNQAAADLGIGDFADIAAHGDALGSRIYGIEPGNDGNRLILDMIAADAFGLGGFEVLESSEQGMLAQVSRADRRGEPIVFLGWEPHPMNASFELDLPDRRRRLVRPRLRWRHGLHQHPRGFRRGLPERGDVPREPRVHARDGERDHGRDPERRNGSRPRRQRPG